MVNVVDKRKPSLEERLKGPLIICDLQTNGFSHFTTVEGIFDMCSADFTRSVLVTNDEIKEWEEEFASYSIIDKKNFVEVFYDYKIVEPTSEVIKEWETYHDESWEIERYFRKQSELNMEMGM